jgi:hypothetical protein
MAFELLTAPARCSAEPPDLIKKEDIMFDWFTPCTLILSPANEFITPQCRER